MQRETKCAPQKFTSRYLLLVCHVGSLHADLPLLTLRKPFGRVEKGKFPKSGDSARDYYYLHKLSTKTHRVSTTHTRAILR